MKIVVLSDTHLPKKKMRLPKRLTDEIKDADLIIHAGDWSTMEVYNQLQTFAKVEGVYGNVDHDLIMEKLPEKIIIDVNDYRIGVTHGHGKGKTTEKRAIEAFNGEKVDCIIYGHSHIPIKKYENDILIFNPGSPTDKRRQEKYSFGVLYLRESTMEADHIFFT